MLLDAEGNAMYFSLPVAAQENGSSMAASYAAATNILSVPPLAPVNSGAAAHQRNAEEPQSPTSAAEPVLQTSEQQVADAVQASAPQEDGQLREASGS
jgi:hypothetical protein